jgi:hypothetical protein
LATIYYESNEPFRGQNLISDPSRKERKRKGDEIET